MCGISGLLGFSGNDSELDTELRKMVSCLRHRGPDNTGFWNDPKVGFKIAHQRLSIIDVSDSGNQPMISNSGRYVIALNGEIYNHNYLRKELEKSNSSVFWKGHSDTEVLLEMIDRYGLKKALVKSDGMFALALWDKKEKKLTLARDRIGEKPIYYGFSGPTSNRIFLFGSELSSLTSWKNFNNKIDLVSLSQLLSYGAISAPRTIYKGINQLLPGHLYTLNYANPSEEDLSSPWWLFTSLIESSMENPFSDEEESLQSLEETITKSVKQQSIADVELGSFLSGGIDSSLITALLQNQSKNKIRTFTIGFEDRKYDESGYAKKIADCLGTDHTEAILTAADAFKIIPNLANIYSEPFADSSQIATHLVCKEARSSNLKVALSGDGGDELFGGYNRYFLGPKLWESLSVLPFPIRKLGGKIILKIPTGGIDIFSDLVKLNKLGQKTHKLAERLKYIKNDEGLYFSLIKEWSDPFYLLKNKPNIKENEELPYSLGISLPKTINQETVYKMMAYDTLNYLPNDILTKVDRASMATSLETRAPFLDHKVVECAWRIGLDCKIDAKNNRGKLILRKILAKYIPLELIERPKMGFGVPIGEWIRGPLKQWADELLAEDLIESQGFLKSEIVNKIYQEHQSRRFDHTAKLWHILMWQSWIERNKQKVIYN